MRALFWIPDARSLLAIAVLLAIAALLVAALPGAAIGGECQCAVNSGGVPVVGQAPVVATQAAPVVVQAAPVYAAPAPVILSAPVVRHYAPAAVLAAPVVAHGHAGVSRQIVVQQAVRSRAFIPASRNVVIQNRGLFGIGRSTVILRGR